MKYSKSEVMQYADEEDVKFIRLAFCDVFGKQKNISIMPNELERAFDRGITIDGSAVEGFGDETHSDLMLHPDPSTISVLPWRPEHGKVVRMFCSVTYPDGGVFESDTRSFLDKAVKTAAEEGVDFRFGTEIEFYLFDRDEDGEKTDKPYDKAGYMDIAPEDKGENVRREICLTLERMGIRPESSHHEEGPGQNEIDFRYAEPVEAAYNAVTFKSVVNTIATLNGLCADFTPKPIAGEAGNGMHIKFAARKDGVDVTHSIMAGVMAHISEITLFLNNTRESYKRFGSHKAPKYISWSEENRLQLIRIPAAPNEFRYAELRSPDPMCNPYIAFALIIYAGLDGIKNGMKLPEPADINFHTASAEVLSRFEKLPDDLDTSARIAKESDFVRELVPDMIMNRYLEI